MQAVVRGRKLRQQLSSARQAATYTSESSQQEMHDSDLDMDQMDDFLASLPDDESLPSLKVSSSSPASTSLPACLPPHANTPYRRQLADSTHTAAESSQLAFAVQSTQSVQSMQGGSGERLETRRGSHARASTSNILSASSVDTSLPAVQLHMNTSKPAASAAPFAVGDSITQSGRKHVHQQQSGFHLPSVTLPTPPSITPSNSSSFSLPPVFPNPIGVSSAYPVAATATSIESTTAAAGAGAAAGDGLKLNGERSARVSRASSSVRSEQSAGSLSPDRAAAKGQRHKVHLTCKFCFLCDRSVHLLFVPHTCFASPELAGFTTG